MSSNVKAIKNKIHEPGKEHLVIDEAYHIKNTPTKLGMQYPAHDGVHCQGISVLRQKA